MAQIGGNKKKKAAEEEARLGCGVEYGAFLRVRTFVAVVVVVVVAVVVALGFVFVVVVRFWLVWLGPLPRGWVTYDTVSYCT